MGSVVVTTMGIDAHLNAVDCCPMILPAIYAFRTR